MAEALLRHEAGEFYEVHSAGTHPGTVRPEAVTVMREIGIDISAQRSKPVTEFQGEHFNFVLTVCDKAREECPAFAGKHSGSTGHSRTRRISSKLAKKAPVRWLHAFP
jgi:arsenate reductase